MDHHRDRENYHGDKGRSEHGRSTQSKQPEYSGRLADFPLIPGIDKTEHRIEPGFPK
jgi:hypothetical protein